MSFTMLLAFVIGIFANGVRCYIFCPERSYLRILVFENEQATSNLLIIHLLAFYSDNDTVNLSKKILLVVCRIN